MTTDIVRRNKRWCLVFQAVYAGGGWGTAVIVAYYETYGLTQLQIHLLQTTWALIATMLSTPCGYLADRFGIRRILVFAGVLQMGQTFLFIQAKAFWQFELVLALSGVVIGLTGGATNALMTITLHEALGDNVIERKELFEQYQRHALAVVCISAGVTMGIGSVIAAAWGMHAPYLCRLAVEPLLVIAPWRCAKIKRKVGLPPAFDAMVKSARLLLRDRPDVRWIIVLDVLFYATSIGAFWLIQPRLMEAGVPLALLGVVMAIRTALPGVLVWLVHWMQRTPVLLAWVLLATTMSTSLVAAGLPASLPGVVVSLVGLSVISACRSVLLNDHLHRSLADDSLRTTELSVISSIETLVFAVTMPLWGWLKDNTSAQTTLLALGITCAAISGLALFRLKRALFL